MNRNRLHEPEIYASSRDRVTHQAKSNNNDREAGRKKKEKRKKKRKKKERKKKEEKDFILKFA